MCQSFRDLSPHFRASAVHRPGERIVFMSACVSSADARLRVYLLGSGPIAVPILKALAASRTLRLCGVGTQPDRPAGRRKVLAPTELGAAALELGLEPERLCDVNDPVFLAHLSELGARILLVASFGQLLKEPILTLPGCLCVNVHASLLPRYRGASPIVQSILNGDEATGVSFMKMALALDAGPVYRTLVRPLDGTEFAGPLELELGELAASALDEVLPAIAAGTLSAVPQPEEGMTICRKIRKQAGSIDWSHSAEEIHRMVRAFTPWPGARTAILSSKGTISAAIVNAAVRPELSGEPGMRLPNTGKHLIVGCGRGTLEILEIAPAGSRTMDAAGFLNGFRGAELRFTAPEPAP